MKAISLHQPWASAIALGYKRIETRSWSTKYRGPLAIHAAKRFGPEQAEVLRKAGMQSGNLPLGAVVATALLVDVLPTWGVFNVRTLDAWWGDFTPGRFAWMLRDIKPVVPLPWKGRQGFFEVPDEQLLPY